MARCEEGFGDAVFEGWMLDEGGPAALIERIQRGFVLGGHKAAAIAGLMGRMEIHLVSSFPDDTVRRMGMVPALSPQAAFEAALARRGSGAKLLVVPHGNRVRARAPGEGGGDGDEGAGERPAGLRAPPAGGEVTA